MFRFVAGDRRIRNCGWRVARVHRPLKGLVERGLTVALFFFRRGLVQMSVIRLNHVGTSCKSVAYRLHSNVESNLLEGGTMNADTLKGQWHQVKGEIKTQWGKLTDNDLDQIAGQSEKLIGKLQERYGYAK